MNFEKIFIDACTFGDLNTVNRIIKSGKVDINISSFDNSGNTPIMLACLHGKTETVQFLLKYDHLDVNKRNSQGKTVLYIACEKGKTEIVKILLQCERVDINLADNLGKTPLIICSSRNSFLEIQLLLADDRKVDLEFIDSQGKTALQYSIENSNSIIHNLLLSFKLDEVKARNELRKQLVEQELQLACISGKTEKVKELLKSDLEFDLNKRDMWDDATPLMNSCHYGHCQIVELLLEDERVQTNLKDGYGRTAFRIACDDRQMNIIKLMLKSERVDINEPNAQGFTPLMMASYHGSLEIVKWMLTSCRKFEIKGKNFDGKNSITLARDMKFTQIANLLKSFHKDPSRVIFDLRKEIHYYEHELRNACEKGDIEKVKEYLAEPGIDINLGDENNYTPLIISCINNQIEITQLLLQDERINPNLYDKNNLTAFFHCLTKERTQILRLMLRNEKVNINLICHSQTPLIYCCLNGNFKYAQLLVNEKRTFVNYRDPDGRTAFFYACQREKKEVVQLLLKCERVDINQKDNLGQTPLMMACSQLEILELLLASPRVLNTTLQSTWKLDLKARFDIFPRREDTKPREQIFLELYELVQSLEENPDLTREKVRKKLNSAVAADFFWLIVLYSDDYLKLNIV